MFEHSAITDQGRALMAACIAAGHAIEFTAYTLGSGTYTDAEKTVAQLKTRQSLKVQKQSFSFVSATSVGAEAILKVQVDNDGLAAGYYMTEAGIWAKDATDNVTPAILYQIGVDDTPSYMPDEDTSPLTIDTECHTVIDNDAEVTFTFTHGAYAWSDDLGDITQLTTTNKNSAVEAINELDSDLGDIEDKFDSDGNLKISHGGTQASNGDDALVNLGAISQHAVSICNWPDEAAFNFRGGRYFYHQLKYYRATKNISAGDTLVPTGVGANCEEVDLADEIERKASIKAITDNIEYDFKCTKAAGYDIDDLVYIECADQLYKVTAAIIQNESMSTSSNIKKWSVEDETSEITSELADKAPINSTMIPRGELATLTSDTQIISLAAGSYLHFRSDSYIPTQYGVLIVFPAGSSYKPFMYMSYDGTLYYRMANVANQTWYSAWKKVTTT